MFFSFFSRENLGATLSPRANMVFNHGFRLSFATKMLVMLGTVSPLVRFWKARPFNMKSSSRLFFFLSFLKRHAVNWNT